MRRVKDNKYGYRSWSEEELKRFGKFLILPLLVILLVIVILAVDRSRRGAEESVSVEQTMGAGQAEEPETETVSEPVSGEAEPSETDELESTASETQASEFSKGGVPEVESLINQYFAAKQSADAETIYQLFGWSDLTGADELRRQLQYDARYTEGYRNVICYIKPGLTEGSYLVYVSYDLKFLNSLTMAPGLLWNYVKQGEDGSYYLTDSASLDEVELAYIAEAEKLDEIVLLKTQIYAKLRQALENDATLAECYSILEKQGGAAGTKQEESQEHEVTVQIGQP